MTRHTLGLVALVVAGCSINPADPMEGLHLSRQVLVMPDGAQLVSDDRAGAVYRISYQG